MKYLARYKEEVKEFNNYKDLQSFITGKENVYFRKITSKKDEEAFYKSGHPKIYVTINQNEVRRFDNWNECKAYCKQNEGTHMKSFLNEEEAQHFINVNTHGQINSNGLVCVVGSACSRKNCLPSERAFAIIKNGVVLYSPKLDNNSKYPTTKRELIAVTDAIKWCIKQNEQYVIVEYNAEGVEMWANGTWKANLDYTQKYQKEMFELQKKITIVFRKKCNTSN